MTDAFAVPGIRHQQLKKVKVVNMDKVDMSISAARTKNFPKILF
jgi:hypothetical protein